MSISLEQATRPRESQSETSHAQHEALGLLHSRALPSRRNRDAEPAYLDTGNHAELFSYKGETANPGREALLESAARHFKNDPEKLQALTRDMAAFEARMGTAGAQDVQNTYVEVARLMDTPSKIVKDGEKIGIAADIIHRAAFSTQSNQGMSNDCAAASLENRLYTRSPAEAAKLVTDTVLSGHFTDAQGRVVTVSHATIAHPDYDLNADARAIGVELRNQGDRVMQAIIRNEEYAATNAMMYGPQGVNSGLKYEIGKPTRENPTGEFVRDYSQRPSVDVSINNLGMRSDLNAVYSGLSSKQNERDFEFADPASTGANVEAFKQKLLAMKGQFPLTVIVNPNEEPFASAPGNRGLADINHAITIESYDAKTGVVRYRNSNFGSKELSISVEKLFDGVRANIGDDVIPFIAKAFKENEAEMEKNPQRAGAAIYDFLNRAEFSQRLQLLRRLEAASGIKLEHYLSREQEKELGIAPTFLESIFGR